MLIKQLQELGLSEKEAKVYLANLELGSSSVQDIARKAGVNRPTTYVQIESLITKGLSSSLIRGKKRYFNAESPEQLERLLDIQTKKIEDKKDNLKSILPELKNIFNLSEEKPKVRFFEGLEGFRAMQLDILRTDIKTFEEVTPIDDAYKIFPSKLHQQRQKIINKFKTIPTRIIYTSKKGKFLPFEEGALMHRFVPTEKFPFAAEIDIYGENKIAVFSMKNRPVGVIIENKEITSTLRMLFDLAWIAAERY